MYQNAYGGLNLVGNGTNYLRFKVTYSDGSGEAWMVNPGYQTSVLKLFDTRFQISLNLPDLMLKTVRRKFSTRIFAAISALTVIAFTVLFESGSVLPAAKVASSPPLAREANNELSSSKSGKTSSSVLGFNKNPFETYYQDLDGRIFVLDHWKDVNGGQYYSSRLVDGCRFLRELTELLSSPQPDLSAAKEVDYLKSSNAMDRLKRRCGQFSDEELEIYSGSALIKEVPNDHLLKAEIDFERARSAVNPQQRKEAILTVISLGDPLLIDQLGLRLYALGGSAVVDLYFDGQRAGLNENSVLAGAAYLVPCLLGADCGSGDPGLLISCASGSGCYASRQEKALTEYAGGDEQKLAAMQEYAGRIALAIETKDVGKFIP